ncbi:MAG: sigma-54-dependent transcriptional regulator, partial [Nitrospirales bacterium]
MPARILVIDDDLDILKGLKDRLKLLGYSPVTAETGEKALELMNQQLPDMVLLDLALPEMSGLEVLRRIGKILEVGEGGESREGSKRGPCELPVVVLTAHGSIENAVDAMKLGAYDFLTKPFEMDHLALVIEKALEREFLKRQVEQLRTEVDSPYATIIGKSPKIQEVIQITRRAADSEVTAFILGETGTGKELFARAIHRWSARHAKPFAVVNCAALPETLLENELFGHEKGAFTGADRLHQGRLESANGGTVFLDEIGDMPLLLQGRLLRVLQDHEVQRVG